MVEGGPPGRVSVGEVVVGHLFSVQLLGLRQAGPRAVVDVQRSLLMRVLAVAQMAERRHVPANHSGNAEAGCSGASVDSIQLGDCDVVLRGVPKCQGRQLFSLGKGESAAAHRGEHTVIAERVGHHRHAGMVLRRRPHHRRAADVDLLDALVDARAGVDRLAERIQVDHYQLERRDPEFFERRGVLGLAQIGEQPGVHARVQGLDPAVEHLGKTGDLLHRGHRNSFVGDGFRG